LKIREKFARTTKEDLMHYLLFYEVADDYASRRAEFRDAHLKKAWEASERGELMLGGALADPVDGAVLLFKGDSPEVAASFARTDPYVTGGVVKRWHVRGWTTVVGPDAALPIQPQAADSGAKSAETAAGGTASSEVSSHGSSPCRATILRIWKGRALEGKAAEYIQHASTHVFPALRAIAGYRGAYLLRRPVGSDVEFTVLTLWESMEAVRRFAGSEPHKAVIDPEARAVLTDFDECVTQFEIVDHRPE
jgi:uncharacterized protein